MSESNYLDIANPEFSEISARLVRYLYGKKKRTYPDALLFGCTFPVSLAIEAKQKYIFQDPTFTPATCVSDHMLGSPRLREITDTPFAPGDFVFSLRWRQRLESGNFDISNGELQGYVDAIVLYVAATEWFREEKPQIALSAIIRGWPGFNALDDSIRQKCVSFVTTIETWAKQEVTPQDVIEGRGFMDKLLTIDKTINSNEYRLRGIRTARDTLLVHVSLITAILIGNSELTEVDDSDNELDPMADDMELAPDGDPRFKGPSLVFLGDTAMQGGWQDIAVDAYTEALPIFDTADEYKEAISCCLKLGNAFLEKEDFASAEEWILEAEHRMETQGQMDDLPACMATLAQVRMRQKRNDDVFSLLHNAQEGFRQAGKTPDAVRCLAIEIEFLANLGRDTEAEKLFASLSEQDRAALVSLHGTSLGNLRLTQGRLEEAAYIFSNALQSATNNDLFQIPVYQCNLAHTRYLQRRLEESISLINEALKSYQKAGNLDETWRCRIKRALFWSAQHKAAMALDDLTRLLQDKTMVNPSTRAEANFLLAQLHLQQPIIDFEAASLAIQRAEAVFEYEGHFGEIPHCQRILGEIRRKQGKLDESEELIREAITQHEAAGDQNNTNTSRYELALVLSDRANGYYWKDPSAALSFATQSERELRTVRASNGTGTQSRDVQLAWSATNLLAILLSKRKDSWRESLSLFQEVVSILDRYWTVQPTVSDRLAVGDIRNFALLNAAVLAVKSGDKAAAYELLLDAKGREGREALGSKVLYSTIESLPNPERSTIKALLAEEEQQRLAMEGISQTGSLQTAHSRIFGTSPNSPNKAAIYARLADLRLTIQQVVSSIGEKYSRFKALVTPQKVGLEDVQSTLRKSEVLLDYLVYEKNAFVFVVTQSSLDVFTLDSEYINNTTKALTTEIDTILDKGQPYSLEPDLLARLGGAFLPDELVQLRPLIDRSEMVLVSPPSSHYGRVPWTSMASEGYFKIGAGLNSRIKPVGVIPAASWLPLTRAPHTSETVRSNQAWVIAADAGPMHQLPIRASSSAKRIAGIYGSPLNEGHLEAHAPGSYEAIRDMPKVAMLHLIAHGEPDQVGGAKIFLLDQAGTIHEAGPEVFWESKSEAPMVAVLSVCWSATTAGSTCGEWFGLATSLLTKGTQAVIVYCWPAGYLATDLLFQEMHRQWAAGAPIGLALENARQWLVGLTLSDLFLAGLLKDDFTRSELPRGSTQKMGEPGLYSNLFNQAVFVLLGDPSICRP